MQRRLPVIIEQLVALNPDVVCLQEVPFVAGGPTSNHIAKALRMHAVAHPISVMSPPYGTLTFGNAILSKLLPTRSESYQLPGIDRSRAKRALQTVTLVHPSGRRLLIGSTHLAWGASYGIMRQKQTAALDRYYELNAHLSRDWGSADDIIGILCGDLNAEPSTDEIRFLAGDTAYEGRTTFWADVWASLRDDPGYTQEPSNPNVAAFSKSFGFASTPQLRRRLDYIWMYGYPFGPAAAPMDINTCFTNPGDSGVYASDHWGLVADFLITPR